MEGCCLDADLARYALRFRREERRVWSRLSKTLCDSQYRDSYRSRAMPKPTSAGVGGARNDTGTGSPGRTGVLTASETEGGMSSRSSRPSSWGHVAPTCCLLATKSFMKSSTLAMRSPRCRLPCLAGDRSSGMSWLTQGARRRWQPIQMASSDEANMHLVFRRLHSQHDRVPLRTLLRLAGISWVLRTAVTGSTSSGTSFMAGCRRVDICPCVRVCVSVLPCDSRCPIVIH